MLRLERSVNVNTYYKNGFANCQVQIKRVAHWINCTQMASGENTAENTKSWPKYLTKWLENKKIIRETIYIFKVSLLCTY